MSKKIRAMVEIEVTLTDEQWQQMKTDYEENWREEIKAGEAEPEMLAGDVWNAMQEHGEPDDFTISWDLCSDEDFCHDEDE